ncbi:MAG TPA: hypothetical protein VLF89_09050 [Candidatus Saccharimonadales bacterium]|nr:hypothetical protein [Candidatus Saccharimonadales bacterium]
METENTLQATPTIQTDLSDNPSITSVQQKSRGLFIIIAVLILCSIFGIATYIIAARKIHPLPQVSQQITQHLTETPTLITPALGETYTDATLGATFQYPSNLKVVYNDWMSGKKESDYEVTLQDNSIIHYSNNKLYVYSNDGIYLGFENNSQKYTLAQYYQHTFPGGMQRYANVSFETYTNPNGIQFQRLILPYKDTEYSYRLEVMHNGKYYSITRTFTPPTGQSQDLYKRENGAFTQIINSFKFTN